MPLPESFIYELKQNNPIDSVMQSYVSLKRQSRGYVCLCPFHSEKTPSCSVNTAEGYFHCFGCGAGGDVITFTMLIENLSYIEAVKSLAERAGMTMPDEARDNDYSRLKARVLEMNRASARFYHEILAKKPEGEKGRRYLRDRQLSNETIIKYGLGYAPDDWHTLHNHLREQGYSDDEMLTANLLTRSQKGAVFDSFRDRVMFPIIDLRGNVVAFGGRIIDGSVPKYLNTSDTPVFKKSRHLFSLNFAKRSSEKRLILAEGYMDVISINQAGFENVVATLGTALTPDQARLMKQYADEVVISYDSDEAGQNATHKAINLLSEAGLETKIIKMEGAKDPDEYIKKFGALRFRQLIDHSDGAIEFELRKCANGLDTENEADKITYLKRCVSFLASISSPIERDVYISRIAKDNGVGRETILQQVNGLIKKKAGSAEKEMLREIQNFSAERRKDPDSVNFKKEYKAERGIISYLYKNPDELSYLMSRITPDVFVTEFNKKLYERFVAGLTVSPDFDIMSLQSEFTAAEMGKITEIVIGARNVVSEREELDDYINILLESPEERADAGGLSDDDFIQLIEKKKSKKK